MSAHTPRTWKVGKHATDPDQLVVSEGGRVVAFLPGNSRIDYAETARLIAAAPRMLEMLRHVPHNNMTAMHKMVAEVAGCPGCEARALRDTLERDKAEPKGE